MIQVFVAPRPPSPTPVPVAVKPRSMPQYGPSVDLGPGYTVGVTQVPHELRVRCPRYFINNPNLKCVDVGARRQELVGSIYWEKTGSRRWTVCSLTTLRVAYVLDFWETPPLFPCGSLRARHPKLFALQAELSFDSRALRRLFVRHLARKATERLAEWSVYRDSHVELVVEEDGWAFLWARNRGNQSPRILLLCDSYNLDEVCFALAEQFHDVHQHMGDSFLLRVFV